MNPIQRAHDFGQSIWMDYIRRDLMESGELGERVAAGEIRGVTSNPTIFERAIAEGDLYTADLRTMAQADWKVEDIFDALSQADIRAATRVFLPLYEQTNGGDGYVSIEVDPRLADKTEETLREARRLWRAINRPNVMIKIPATKAGIPAIQQAIAEGINVNVTLIFSLERYAEVMEAYLRGLEIRHEQGASLDHVASVASFFVSRIDTAVDKQLEDVIREEGPHAERAAALLGKAAIANAKLAYAQFKATFGERRFAVLAQLGARVQRPLWASTGTKNPNYPDTYYVDNLIGPHTVNTVPPQTIDAFRDHGCAELTLERGFSDSLAQLEALEALGVSMDAVTYMLERDGVAKFAQSYNSLLKTLRSRSRALRKELVSLLPELQETLTILKQKEVGRRLWEGDTSLWTRRADAARKVEQRLGWLELPKDMPDKVGELITFADELRQAGFRKAVLLGMGGSSLAADVLRRTFAEHEGMDLAVLDSTNPAAVGRVTRQTPIDGTLFIVASKSGTTSEPLALMEYFWARARRRVGEAAGDHFVAITDAGTPLEKLARERGFRRVFTSPLEVGGRYAALSVFGLLPAALMGVDTLALLRGAEQMARACGQDVEPVRNPGLFLGAVLATAALHGKDKLTLITDPGIEALPDWIEQLIAESSGKQGKGIWPVIGEPPGPARVYAEDRLLVYLRQDGAYDRRVRGWVRTRQPVLVLETGGDANGFGRAFFQWEFATAVACHLLGVNAFDQPDVQKAKDRTKDLLDVYREHGSIPHPAKLWQGQGVTLFGKAGPVNWADGDLEDALARLLTAAESQEVLVFLVYLWQSGALAKRMARLRRTLRDRLGMTTTLGFGPRYLHSSGQLHKGGPAAAMYLIVTAEASKDIEVPESGVTLGALERAQAMGDLQALLALGRPAFGIHLDSPARFQDFQTAFLKVGNRLHT